ncbi:hypothetical protein [Streptomyces sp. CB02130]|uniref:hypothetical protein n=1 Tax=Streptomyces sp. CB02130 TaxID=1703934 RepID=UPI0011611AF9|nr:hypothetical protein [Streptomyces sp. CB02130]
MTAITFTAATVAGSVLAADSAFAGGVGDFLSPAFGTDCANLHTGAHAAGATTHGSGAASANLAGLPIVNPLNQCGGADVDPVSQVGPVGVNTGTITGNAAHVGEINQTM